MSAAKSKTFRGTVCFLGTSYSTRNLVVTRWPRTTARNVSRIVSQDHFFPLHCTYVCVLYTNGAGRIYFSSLYLSWSKPPYGRGLFPCSQREREVEERIRKKSRTNNTLPGPGFQPTDSSSRAERAKPSDNKWRCSRCRSLSAHRFLAPPASHHDFH